MSTSSKLDCAIKANGWRFNANLGAFYDALGERVSSRQLRTLIYGTTDDERASLAEDTADENAAVKV